MLGRISPFGPSVNEIAGSGDFNPDTPPDREVSENTSGTNYPPPWEGPRAFGGGGDSDNGWSDADEYDSGIPRSRIVKIKDKDGNWVVVSKKRQVGKPNYNTTRKHRDNQGSRWG